MFKKVGTERKPGSQFSFSFTKRVYRRGVH